MSEHGSSTRERIAEILSGRGVVLRSQAALIDELAALLSPADAPTAPAEPTVVEVVRRSYEGWANVLELNLILPQHRETAEALREETWRAWQALRAAPVAPTAREPDHAELREDLLEVAEYLADNLADTYVSVVIEAAEALAVHELAAVGAAPVDGAAPRANLPAEEGTWHCEDFEDVRERFRHIMAVSGDDFVSADAIARIVMSRYHGGSSGGVDGAADTRAEFLRAGWVYSHAIASNGDVCSDGSCHRCRLAKVLIEAELGGTPAVQPDAVDAARNPWEPYAWPGLSHAQYDAIGTWLCDTHGDRYATRLVVQTPENVLVCSIQRDWWERLLSSSEHGEVGRHPNAIAAGAPSQQTGAAELCLRCGKPNAPLKPEGT